MYPHRREYDDRPELEKNVVRYRSQIIGLASIPSESIWALIDSMHRSLAHCRMSGMSATSSQQRDLPFPSQILLANNCVALASITLLGFHGMDMIS